MSLCMAFALFLLIALGIIAVCNLVHIYRHYDNPEDIL